MSVRELAQQAATSPKTASAVSALTTGTGFGTIMEWIPDDIGKLATLVGIVLSLVLIRNHWRKGSADNEKLQLEIRALKAQENERDRRRSEEDGRPIEYVKD